MTTAMDRSSVRACVVKEGDAPAVTLVPGHIGIGLVVEDDGVLRFVSEEDLGRWQTSVVELLPDAMERLHAESPAADWQPVHTVPGMRLFVSGDGQSSARMLIVERLFPSWPLGGVLMAVPSPDQLLCVPLDALEDLDALNVLATAARYAHNESATPVSDQVFWHDGRQWHAIEVLHREDEVELVPPQSFLTRIGQLAAMNMVAQAGEA